jgi:uncharacterized protein (TIGR02996 family)
VGVGREGRVRAEGGAVAERVPLSRTEEGRAFLREVCDHPDDDAPRLVFADWLDDHGDHARAEFIRLQCTLAADEWKLQAAERARELWYDHANQWLAEVPGWLRSRCEFARGFPALVKCSAEEWLERGAELEFVPLETARLSGATGRVPEIAASPHLRRLAGLDLSDNRLGDADAVVLAESPGLSGLRRLDLGMNNVGDLGVATLAASPYLSSLRELDLSANRVGDEGARWLAVSRHLLRLVRLHLGHNAVGDAGAAALAASPLPALEVVNLHNNRVSDALALELYQQRRPSVRA